MSDLRRAGGNGGSHDAPGTAGPVTNKLPEHVAIVCPALGGNGAVANVAIHHARELADRFRVSLASDSFPVEDIPGVDRIVLRPKEFGFLRRFAHVPNEVSFALAAKAAIANRHNETLVDWIICHGHAVAALTARPMRKKLGIPYALVTHGDIFDRPKGTYDPRLTQFYRQVTRPAYRSADLVVALSPHMATMAIQGGAIPERVVIIPNGIEPAEIGLDAKVLHSSRKVADALEVLYVGRLSVEKGVDLLLQAAALLARREMKFRLRIVGAGPEEGSLRQLIGRWGLGTSVELVGPVPRIDLGSLYRLANVACVPSRSDPLPTVVLEAMLAGVPVVGADTGGIPFMVEHERTGLIYPANDPGALADALWRLGSDESLLCHMGTAARTRVMEEFSWDRVGESLGEALLRQPIS